MSIIDALLCLLSNFVAYVEIGAVDALNATIVGLAAALTAILPLLPDMPAFPTLSDSSWFALLNWIVPLSSYVSLGGTLVTIFVSVYGVRIALRWIKAM